MVVGALCRRRDCRSKGSGGAREAAAFERDFENTSPQKDFKLVLYCGGGFPSALVTDSLR